MKMELKMNLFSMIVLFLALAGFDHFYQNLLQHQGQLNDSETSELNREAQSVTEKSSKDHEEIKINWPPSNLLQASVSFNRFIEKQLFNNSSKNDNITKQ